MKKTANAPNTWISNLSSDYEKVKKTINEPDAEIDTVPGDPVSDELPYNQEQNTAIEDLRQAFEDANNLGLKGIHIYIHALNDTTLINDIEAIVSFAADIPDGRGSEKRVTTKMYRIKLNDAVAIKNLINAVYAELMS